MLQFDLPFNDGDRAPGMTREARLDTLRALDANECRRPTYATLFWQRNRVGPSLPFPFGEANTSSARPMALSDAEPIFV
jgi:hypothetical protein